MSSRERVSNRRLRALLAETGWTQNTLARTVNSLAARRGLRTRYDRTSVSHWLAGAHPRAPVPELIREAFSRRLARTVTSLDTGFTETGGHAGGWTAASSGDPVTRLAEMAAAETDPVHRAEARALSYDPGAVPPAWPSTGLTRPAEGPLSLHAHAMRRATGLYVFHIEAFGGGHARSPLAAQLAGSVPQWLRHSGGGERQALFGGAARLTHLLALAVADMGAEGQAQGYHLTAARLAVEAGDRAMYALSVRALSTQALRTGRVEAARRLARDAVVAAPPGASPALHAYLEVQLALALAHTGDREAALAALASAEQSMGRADHGTAGAEGPFDRYPIADFTYQKAMALSALGERSPALRALHASLRHRGPARSRSRALTRARLAELCFTGGDLETAAAHWHTVVEEAGRLDSRQVRDRLAHMRRELRPYRRSVVVAALLARDAELAT